MADVVYIVGPDERTDELRYSLRSLAAHVDHDDVYIVGHCPDWVVDVHHVDTGQIGLSRANARRNVEVATRIEGLSDPFMLWNDDFHAMRHIGKLPVLNAGPIDDILPAIPAGPYQKDIADAGRWLQREHGIDQPIAYDALHVPQWYTKADLGAVLGMGAVMWQTVYGNLYRTDPGHTVPNAKLPGGFMGRDWLSTSVVLWESVIGDHIRATFPEPGPYER